MRVTPVLVAPGPPKWCPDCGAMRPRKDFPAYRRGERVYAYGRCRHHWGVVRNAQRTREAQSRLDRAKWDRIRNDPEALAIHRDRNRQHHRRRFGVTPDRCRTVAPSRGGAPAADPAPFVAWLRTLGANANQIALATGIEAAYVRRLLKGEYDTVELDTVDRAILHADVVVDGLPVTLDDLYPLDQDQAA